MVFLQYECESGSEDSLTFEISDNKIYVMNNNNKKQPLKVKYPVTDVALKRQFSRV